MRLGFALPTFLSNLIPRTSTAMALKMSTATTVNAVLSIADRKKAALFGLFVADATAMPVHWMYDLRNLQNDYGEVKGYMKPKDQFIGSIMNLSNTGGGGRGSDKGDIVGDVILHGKKKYWQRGGNNHYHLGLQAGENTLEAQLVRVLSKSISSLGTFSANDFRERYIKFMTTPGNHNDTYASTCHRMFFANWVKGMRLTALVNFARQRFL
jgi:ADP-ribosylglycohydrolase